MKVTVLNGTQIQGITYHLKEYFLDELEKDAEIAQFYPKDYPAFCLGCKNCFLHSESLCPHYKEMVVIWDSILNSDLIVVAYPVYALRVPGSLKTLLDHLCVHWLVHRPNEKMFKKKVVILTNSVGLSLQQKKAQRDVRTSFSWMGISKIYSIGAGMMGDIFWDKISFKSKTMLQKKARKIYKRANPSQIVKHNSLFVNLKFYMCKSMHANILKNETTPSVDNQYFLDKGWIRDTRKKRL